MWSALGEAHRRALRRRRAALHRHPRRRREGVLARQRHRRVRHRALEQGAGDRLRRGRCTRTAEALVGLPASAGRADPRHLRRRRPGDRGAVRPPHLRRVEPLRRADQEPRPGDGVCRRWRRWCALVGPRRRARDPARGPHLRRAPRRRRRASSRASCPTPQVEAEARATAQRIADGAPLVARWHKKFARRLARPAAAHARPSTTRRSTASTPRTSGSATRRSSPSGSRRSIGR